MALTAHDERVDPVAALKQEMVAGYHILAREGLGIGLLGHLTARAPAGDSFWTYQLGQSFEEVAAGDLREADFDLDIRAGGGAINPTLKIHALTYQARPDVMCIAHHHGQDSVAMGAIGALLETVDRNAAKFDRALDIIEDYDQAHRIAEQGDAIIGKLGSKRALILKHHGVLVTGRSVRDTVVATIMLERCFAVQLEAMAAAPMLHRMDEAEIADAKGFLNSDVFVDGTWDYLKRATERDRAAGRWTA
jgi:L-fuculose-phosphate aldolase